MTGRPIQAVTLGTVEYPAALELQRRLCQERRDGTRTEDLLLLLQHPPVVTLGRGTRATSLPQSPEALRASGFEVVEVERGGDVTVHGPGQLVGYPILDLTHYRQDLHWYLRTLEAMLIDTLAAVGITGRRRDGLTGVWVEERKIASIGIHVKQWVTFHGFALNVSTDLALFDRIVPCGIAGVEMTSVAREKPGSDPAALHSRIEVALLDAVARAFDRPVVLLPARDLDPPVPSPRR